MIDDRAIQESYQFKARRQVFAYIDKEEALHVVARLRQMREDNVELSNGVPVHTQSHVIRYLVEQDMARSKQGNSPKKGRNDGHNKNYVHTAQRRS